MADDWIRVRTELVDDPAVIELSRECEDIVDQDHAVGKLIRFWSWATDHSADGWFRNVPLEWVDTYVKAKSFGKILARNGWLSRLKNGFRVNNWDRFLSQGSKERILAAERQRKHRSQKCHGATVTKALPEKRREEEEKRKKKKKKRIAPSRANARSEPVDGEVWGKGRIRLDVAAGHFIGITDKDRETWAKAYPAVNLELEFAKMVSWSLANPTLRKSNYPAFITRWLTRAQDRGGSNGVNGRTTSAGSGQRGQAEQRRAEQRAREFDEGDHVLPVH